MTGAVAQRALLLRLAEAIAVGAIRVGRCAVCLAFIVHPPGARRRYCSRSSCQEHRKEWLRARVRTGRRAACRPHLRRPGRTVTMKALDVARLALGLALPGAVAHRDATCSARPASAEHQESAYDQRGKVVHPDGGNRHGRGMVPCFGASTTRPPPYRRSK